MKSHQESFHCKYWLNLFTCCFFIYQGFFPVLMDLGIIRGFMLVNMQLCFRSDFFFFTSNPARRKLLKHAGLFIVLLLF